MKTKATIALRKRAQKIGATAVCERLLQDAEMPAKGKAKQAQAAVKRCFREWLAFTGSRR